MKTYCPFMRHRSLKLSTVSWLPALMDSKVLRLPGLFRNHVHFP